MSTHYERIFRNGSAELIETSWKIKDETKAIVSLQSDGQVDLREFGIDQSMATGLCVRL